MDKLVTLKCEEAVYDFGTGVTADFQQSGKVAYKTLLLTNLIKSIAIQTGEALINFVGISSTPIALWLSRQEVHSTTSWTSTSDNSISETLVFLPIYEVGDVWEGGNSLTVLWATEGHIQFYELGNP